MTTRETIDVLRSSREFESVCSDRTRILARVDNVATLALWVSIVAAIIGAFASVMLLAIAIASFAMAVVVKKWNYPRLRASFLADALATGMPRKAARQLWFETMEK